MEKPNPDPRSASSSTSIADVLDKLLIEIFVRLPSVESVITCKLVSKHWLSLLSNPKFVIKFVNHKKTTQTQKQVLPWTFLSTMRLKGNDEIDNKDAKSLIEKHNKVFSSPKFSLNFLGLERLKVAATFKDLILCLDISRLDHRYYYICNPITKHWVALPPTPSPLIEYDHRDGSWAGLICEGPYYYDYDDDDHHNIDDYRFRIVVVPIPNKRIPRNRRYDPFFILNMKVFCSENCQWIDVDLRIPLNPGTGERLIPFKAVLCKGMVCIAYYKYFGMFNPFDVAPTTPSGTTLEAKGSIPLPPLFSKSKLLECGGRLISVLPNPSSRCPCYRRNKEGVTKLVNIKEGVSVSAIFKELDLNQVVDNHHNNNSDDDNEVLVSASASLCWRRYGFECLDKTGISRSILSGIRMMGIHPTNNQLLYIITHENKLLLCDRASSSLKTLGECDLLPDHLQFSNHRLELQCWPTPLPTILRSDTSKSNDF
ncbi:hypothetical protein RDABS01_015151 [Bienertia sinuspersici]